MIKRKIAVLTAAFVITLLSCNTGSIETKAYIFERKQTDNGKLMICYAFNTGKKLIHDSLIVENFNVPQDSIAVVYQKNNPTNSNLLMPGLQN